MRRYLDSHVHGHDGGSVLPLPLRERAGVRGFCSRMFQLPLPPQPNRDAVRGFLPGLFRSFAFKRHVQ